MAGKCISYIYIYIYIYHLRFLLLFIQHLLFLLLKAVWCNSLISDPLLNMHKITHNGSTEKIQTRIPQSSFCFPSCKNIQLVYVSAVSQKREEAPVVDSNQCTVAHEINKNPVNRSVSPRARPTANCAPCGVRRVGGCLEPCFAGRGLSACTRWSTQVEAHLWGGIMRLKGCFCGE